MFLSKTILKNNFKSLSSLTSLSQSLSQQSNSIQRKFLVQQALFYRSDYADVDYSRGGSYSSNDRYQKRDYGNDRAEKFERRPRQEGGYQKSYNDRGGRDYHRGDSSDYRGGNSRNHDRDYRDNKMTTSKSFIPTFTYEQVKNKTYLKDLSESIRAKLVQNKVEELLPVQQVTYPFFLEGKQVVVKSRTGTGKTLSFLLPLQALIDQSKEAQKKTGIQAIILEPTRELAIQVQSQIEKYTNLKSVLVYGGGVSRYSQMDQIKRGNTDIIVATPGRLIDLIENEGLNLQQVKYQILDEGDKMLDMGFQDDIEKIQGNLSPEVRSMVFSATIPEFIQEMAAKTFKDPVLIDLVGNDTNQIPERITHRAILIKGAQDKFRQVQQYIENNRDKKIIIFSETKQEARQFEQMKYAKFFALHGDLEQSARETRLKQFRSSSQGSVLVATDVASRGLDIDDVDVVIQLGCRHVDSFVHRSGRTGRVGKEGENILFIFQDELEFVMELEKDLKISIDVKTNIQEVDIEKYKHKLMTVFKTQATKHHQVQADPALYAGFKELILENPNEEESEKYISYLIDYYLGQKSVVVNQNIGFITGEGGLKTYLLRVNTKQIGQKTRQQIKDLFVSGTIRNQFDITQDGIDYLFDANEEQLQAVANLLPSDKSHYEFKEVNALTSVEKKILGRKRRY